MYFRLRIRLRKLAALGLLTCLAWHSPQGLSRVRAQQINPQLRESFLSDPLADESPDPLIPDIPINRDFSPLELAEIDKNLDALNQEAQSQFSSGEIDTAFALWRREIRLRRIQGTPEEFAVIQQVATLAWAQQRQTDVQLLTLRAREIWDAIARSLNEGVPEPADTDAERLADENSPPPDPEDSLVSGAPTADEDLLLDLAQTFVTLRDIDSSVDVYQRLIELNEAEGRSTTDQRIALAELHLDWFQFADAADVYLALLNEARSQQNTAAEIAYLERLAYSYQQADSLRNAVRAQTTLLELYQVQGEEEKFPALMLAIAQNYRALNLLNNAIEYYRSAYAAAQRFEQFSFSARVLQGLGSLYRSVALTDEALGAYTLLVPVEEQAYNTYGIMNAYDNIGQLQRRKGNDLEALKAFEKALVLANQLGLQEDYFIEQIESVTPALPANSNSQ